MYIKSRLKCQQDSTSSDEYRISSAAKMGEQGEEVTGVVGLSIGLAVRLGIALNKANDDGSFLSSDTTLNPATKEILYLEQFNPDVSLCLYRTKHDSYSRYRVRSLLHSRIPDFTF